MPTCVRQSRRLVACASFLSLVIVSWSSRLQGSPTYAKLDCFNLTICGRLLPNTDLKTPGQATSVTQAAPLSRPLKASASPEQCETCALKGEFPWYARLELYFKDDTDRSRYCGATVIDRLFLLTSASCVKRPRLGMAQRGFATLGLQNLMESADRWQVRSIRTFCSGYFDPERVYSNFSDLSMLAEDVTVVKLNATLDYNERVAPICLRNPDSLFDWNPEQFVMAGFGIYDELEQMPPARLSKHIMRPCDNKELMLMANRRRPDQVCAIDAKCQGNPCEGDQGNGIYARLPFIKQMGLHSILGLPASRCQAGHAEPVLLSELTNLKEQIKGMLSGC